ncbi:MAG: ABC transporter permease subunit, partial [Gaiellales bacterium]
VAYLALRRIRAAWVWMLVLLPALLPHVVAGLVVVAWVGPGGILDRILEARPIELYRDSLGAGAILAYVWKESAFILMLLIAGAPRELKAREEMSRTSGLGQLQTIRSVTLPALARAAMVGCVTVLVFAIGALEIPALLGPSSPQTLAEATVDVMSLDVLTGQSTAAALAIMTALLAMLLAALLLGAVLVARAAERRGVRRAVRRFATGKPT